MLQPELDHQVDDRFRPLPSDDPDVSSGGPNVDGLHSLREDPVDAFYLVSDGDGCTQCTNSQQDNGSEDPHDSPCETHLGSLLSAWHDHASNHRITASTRWWTCSVGEDRTSSRCRRDASRPRRSPGTAPRRV